MIYASSGCLDWDVECLQFRVRPSGPEHIDVLQASQGIYGMACHKSPLKKTTYKLTWNLNITQLKGKIIWTKTSIFGFNMFIFGGVAFYTFVFFPLGLAPMAPQGGWQGVLISASTVLLSWTKVPHIVFIIEDLVPKDGRFEIYLGCHTPPPRMPMANKGLGRDSRT